MSDVAETTAPTLNDEDRRNLGEIPDDIRERFRDHRAHVVDRERLSPQAPDDPTARVTALRFTKPGTGIDSLTYRIERRRYLVVTGDLGDAIYEWPQRVSLYWVAGCNLDYFAGKCVASEYGRGYRVWRSDHAMRRLREIVETYKHDEGTESWLRSEVATIAEEDVNTQFEWAAWVMEPTHDGRRYEFFSDLGDIGMVIDERCREHLYALRLAVMRLP